MIDYSTLPIQPPAPLPEGATDAQRAAWLDQHRVCAMYAQAEMTLKASEEKAKMAAAMNRAAASQEALAASMTKPSPKPFDRQTFMEEVAKFLAATPLTPDSIAKKAAGVAEQVEQEVQRWAAKP